MNTEARIIGNHGKFFPAGRALDGPEPVPKAGRETKPESIDPGWQDFGVLSEISIEPQTEERVIFRPSPGRLRKYDVLETKDDLQITLRAEELSVLAIQALFRTAELDETSTIYKPLEGQAIKGWLKVSQYDQNDHLFNSIEVFAHLKVAAVAFGDDVARVEFTGSVLDSTLNAGTLLA